DRNVTGVQTCALPISPRRLARLPGRADHPARLLVVARLAFPRELSRARGTVMRRSDAATWRDAACDAPGRRPGSGSAELALDSELGRAASREAVEGGV